MKTFLVLCLITTLAMVVTWANARLHDDHRDNNAVVEVSDKKINPKPCKSSNTKGYILFKKRHILEHNFNTSNNAKWGEYLKNKDLCGRVLVQSFFKKDDETNVKMICRSQGLVFERNLCVSIEDFRVFHVISTAGSPCIINCVVEKKQKVILGCDEVHRSCLPVHYENYKGQQPGRRLCSSEKVPSMQNIF